MFARRGLLPACILAAVTGLARAEERSGPAAGARAEPFEAFAATGGFAGSPIDVVTKRENEPTVYVFIQADKFDRPIARFLKVLDNELSAGIEGVPTAESVAVWLTRDVGKTKEYLPRAQQSIQLERTTLTVFEGDPAGPKGWELNLEAHVTIVVTKGGKVVKSGGHNSINEKTVPEVVAALKAK